ncbi:MAG TPA: GAF domain-containing protein, partial [Solirubrobacteraceae bacterium]|nr:GAF domain-containing protein [Solirubrobacteraceae bacterium]
EALMDELLELLASRLDAPLAMWWAPADAALTLRCEAFFAEPGLDDAGALRHRATAPQPFADGLAARAWDAEEPVAVRIDSGLEGLDAAPRAAALAAAGLRSMLAVPVAGPDGALGVIELARAEEVPLPGPLLDALTTTGVLAGHALAAGRASASARAPFGSPGQPVPSRADAEGADSDLAA